jgi:hypothetical protein
MYLRCRRVSSSWVSSSAWEAGERIEGLSWAGSKVVGPSLPSLSACRLHTVYFVSYGPGRMLVIAAHGRGVDVREG